MGTPFSFITKLFKVSAKSNKATHARTLTSPQKWVEFTEAINNYGGVGGSTLAALRVSTAFACIDRIAKDIAPLPLRPVRSVDNGVQIAKDHDQYFISKNPSPYFTKYTWLYTSVFHMYEYGECLCPIKRKNGRPIEYGLWMPNEVELKEKDGKRYWYHTVLKELVNDDDMVHVMDYTRDGKRGYSRLKLAKSTIDLASQGAKMAASLYANQMWSPGYISLKNDLTSEQAEMISKTWGGMSGENGADQIRVIDNGGEFKHFGMSLKDSDYSPTMLNAALEICRFMGVAPSKVGIMTGNVSYNSLEQENISHVQNVLLPICVAWEQELNRKSLSLDDTDVSFKFELKGRLRGDMAARAAFYQMGLTTGLLSINDTLRLEDMDTIGPEGDERYINAASVPLSKLYSGELEDKNQDDQIKQLVKGLKLNGNGTHKVQ